MMMTVPFNHGTVVVINFQLFFGRVCVLANQAVSPLGFLDRLYHQELASTTGVQPRSEGILGLKIPFLGVNLNLGGKKKKKGPKTIVIYEEDDDNDDDESRKPLGKSDIPREGRDKVKGRRRKKNGRYFGRKRKPHLDDNRGISVNITKDEVSKGIKKKKLPKENPIHDQKSSKNDDEKGNMEATNVSKEKTSLRKQQNVINTDIHDTDDYDLNKNDSSTENLPKGSFAVKNDIKRKETILTAVKEPSTGKNQKSLKIRDHKEVKDSMIKLDDSSQGSGTKEDHETSSDDTEKQDIKLEKMNNNSEKSKDDLHKTSKDDTAKQDIELEKVNNSSEKSKDDLHKTSSDDTAKQDIKLEKVNNSEKSKDDLHKTSKDDSAKQDIKLEKVNNSSEETEIASLKDLWIETEDTEQVDTQDETEEKETKESADEEHSKLENENHPDWLESSQNETQNGARKVSDDELNEKKWHTDFPSENGKPVPENASKQENKEGVEGKRYEYKITSPDKKMADIIHTQAMEEPDKKLEQESKSSTNDGEITILVHKD